MTSASATWQFFWPRRIVRMGELMSAGDSDGRGDLVQQGLEHVVVAPIDHASPRPDARPSAFAAARPAKPPPTMKTLGVDADAIAR